MELIEYDKSVTPEKGDLVRIRSTDEVKKLFKDVYTFNDSRGRLS